MRVRILKKTVSMLMVLNFGISILNATSFPSLLTIGSAYIAFSPLLLSLNIIGASWLHLISKGKPFLYFRAVVLWPVTIIEYYSHVRLLKRVNILLGILEKMPMERRKDSNEFAELMKIRDRLKSLIELTTI